MKLQRLIVLLPCHSLEDLSLKRDAYQADGLLAAWSILWHPALIAAADASPGWLSASSPPDDTAGCLLTLPSAADSELPYEWRERVELGGGYLVGQRDREEMLEEALSQLDERPAVDPELAADFQAMGLCYFYVELLTRQLRYMSNLDESTLQSRVLAAAKAAVQGDVESARSVLQTCFDLLNEAREYFYPVEGHLVDLTLVAESTTGAELRAELGRPIPTNLLMSGQTLERLATDEPETLKALGEALAQGRATLVGGEWSERMLPLLGPESIADDLRRGLESYQRHLGERPVVYGRRRFGLTPVLPQILDRLGFTGCLHFTLDDGRFPTGNQSRIRWAGFDETTIEALTRVPVDAGSADSFLRLTERLGEAMDLDHSPTMVFAHWPGQASSWFGDLARIAGYTSALGSFASLKDYVGQSGAGQSVTHPADQYRSPYLRQAVTAGQVDPLSRFARYWRRQAQLDAWQSAVLMAGMLGAKVDHTPPLALVREVEDCLDTVDPSQPEPGLDQRIAEGLQQATRRLAEQIVGGTGVSPVGMGGTGVSPVGVSTGKMPVPPKMPAPTGTLRLNPSSFSRRQVPGMGFDWVGADQQSGKAGQSAGFAFWRAKPKAPPPMIEGHRLKNEYLEVTIDPHTGGIRSVTDSVTRANRLGQQLAIRMLEYEGSPEAWQEEYYAPTGYTYSIMAAEDIAVASSGPDYAEVRCRGRLVDRENRRLAGFVQTVRLRRGSRLVELDIELDPDWSMESDPWRSYCCARFAWHDETAELRHSVNLVSQRVEGKHVEAPHFFEIRSGRSRTAIFTGGLTYHRRQGFRMLDTLLLVQGETQRKFRLAAGFDLAYPMAAAIDFLAPELSLPAVPPPQETSGWLLRLDARNVLATRWEPIVEAEAVVGFRVHLLETEGRKTSAGLQCRRGVQTARRLDGDGQPGDPLAVEGDRIALEIGPYQWLWLEAQFSPLPVAGEGRG